MRLVKVAVACVNQTPFAWEQNFAHLRMAIEHARGPRGRRCYACPSWRSPLWLRGRVLHGRPARHRVLPAAGARTADEGMVVCVGVPVFHEKALYNAAAILADGDIVGFAAKQFLAGDGIHYEPRWFKPWPAGEIDWLERADAPTGLATCTGRG